MTTVMSTACEEMMFHPVRGYMKRVKPRVIPEALITKDLARFPIGNDRYVVVCLFKGETKVHIREFSFTNRPTLRGICLTPSRWATLMSRVDLLDDEFVRPAGSDKPGMHLVEEGEHLGGFVYAKASNEYKTVDIRQYFIPEGGKKEIPTRKGIRLRNFEWVSLKNLAKEITESSPELSNAIPCSMQLDHSNIEGFLACKECNPSGDTNL